MIRRLILLSSVILMASLYTQSVEAGCKGCDSVASGKDGFCCGKGSAFGVKIASKELYAALVGQKVSAIEAAKCPCKDCKKAASENGRCDSCKYIAGKLYKSPVSYALAKGTPISQELIKACPKRCNDCKSAFKGNGKCENCNVGFVAGRMFENKKEYKAALVVHQIG